MSNNNVKYQSCDPHLYYNYSDFSNIKEIGEGKFGKVYRAERRNSEQYFVLKSLNFDKDIFEEIVREEINLQRAVDVHDKIIRFLGITNSNSEKLLVMEYADNGSLQDYLKQTFNKLTWNNKYELAFQLAYAVSFLHNKKIVHRDLNSSNVLVHQNNIKLANFGLLKRIKMVSESQLFDAIPYIDPQKLIDKNFSLNERSDVYSIGVLLWEISSGKRPFCDVSYDCNLAKKISQGRREEIVSECWNNKQNNRPTIKQVVEKLKEIKENPIFINVNKNLENITKESNKHDDYEGCNVMFQIKIMKHASHELILERLSSLELNLHDKLSNIREKLKKDNDIMNDTLSFANSSMTEIAREDEKEIILKEIIDAENNTLYLIEPDYDFLINKLKLEYGHTISLDRANKKAFKITGYDITEIADAPKCTEINLKEGQFMEKDIFLFEDIDTNKRTNNSTCTVIEYSKVSLKFKTEPNPEFIKAVKDAIESKDPRKFRKITEEFGKFVPKEEVILGARAYFVNTNSSNSSKNCTKYTNLKLIGGKKFISKDFNKKEWLNSLEEFRNWDCIKIKNPISIFKLLPEDLRKEIFLLVGKKILYLSTEIYEFKLNKPGNHENLKLKNIPKDILETLKDEVAECSIFATVVDKNRMNNDIFNCQIFWPPNQEPKLIIHCIQKKFKERKCKLKIMIMITGYDMNFNFDRPDFNIQFKVESHNFNASDNQTQERLLAADSSHCFGIPVLRKLDDSANSLIIGHHFYNFGNERTGLYTYSYCSKNNCYDHLPDFTFHTFVILDYSSNCSEMSSFNHSKFIKNILTKHDSLKPKFISLYSTTKENDWNKYGPIFLKQKSNGLNGVIIKYFASKNKISKDNFKYAYFDPSQEKDLISYMENLKTK
ncbi:uncharacterized protein OCT59_002633 [Rhizophagus irregularis]|uniref:uncharacterized protein n=1 Tax=Rhizophagus irregularis TaxID=588596 RepID=UPI003328779C|nr:hypothetical protein OCT59_002633 [Rhizophagus irregularis]